MRLDRSEFDIAPDKLTIDAEQLAIIAAGTYHPRSPDEPDLDRLKYSDICAIFKVGEALANMASEPMITFEPPYGEAHSFSTEVRVPYPLQSKTIQAMGAWARRQQLHLETQQAKPEVIDDARTLAEQLEGLVGFTRLWRLKTITVEGTDDWNIPSLSPPEPPPDIKFKASSA